MPAVSTCRLAVLYGHVQQQQPPQQQLQAQQLGSRLGPKPINAASSASASAAEVRAHEKTHGTEVRTWEMSDEELYLFDTMVTHRSQSTLRARYGALAARVL